MDGFRYRSYLVRAWHRMEDDRPARLRLEEIQSGRAVELRGEQAAVLAGAITAALPAVEIATPNEVKAGPSILSRRSTGCSADRSLNAASRPESSCPICCRA